MKIEIEIDDTVYKMLERCSRELGYKDLPRMLGKVLEDASILAVCRALPPEKKK